MELQACRISCCTYLGLTQSACALRSSLISVPVELQRLNICHFICWREIEILLSAVTLEAQVSKSY